MTTIFDPIRIRDVEIRNRVWLSPMCQYSVETRDGVPNEWQLVHLGGIAKGGAGLVMSEATAVRPDGRLSWKDTGIWNDEQAAAWEPITRFIRSQGAVAGLQLSHAGRKASMWPEWERDGDRIVAKGQPSIARGNAPRELGGWQTVAPTGEAFEGLEPPHELSAGEIAELVDEFAAAAARGVKAGFEVFELHAAHGYLIHEFLSPLSNSRTDAYGGPLENRARFLLELVAAVRKAIGHAPLFVRFSATDWVEGGWTPEETTRVARWCHEAGADLFDVSSGGNSPAQKIPVGPGYQVPLASQIREETSLPVVAVGLISEARQAQEIVESGQADAVMLGRELLRDPHFVLRAARELGVSLDYWPPQYERANR